MVCNHGVNELWKKFEAEKDPVGYLPSLTFVIFITGKKNTQGQPHVNGRVTVLMAISYLSDIF